MLAILMEAYTNVKSKTKDSMSVWGQIGKQYRRWRQARLKQRVRLNDIFDALLEHAGGNEDDMLENEKLLFPDKLPDIVPNLKEEQAVRTMRDAKAAELKKTE